MTHFYREVSVVQIEYGKQVRGRNREGGRLESSSISQHQGFSKCRTPRTERGRAVQGTGKGGGVVPQVGVSRKTQPIRQIDR